MCGNIKKLRYADRPATDQEIDAAVLQFVRKISGVREPSAANRSAFDATRAKIARTARTMLAAMAREAGGAGARFKRV